MKRIFSLILVLVPSVAVADKTFSAGKGATWDCKKDPVVSIAHGKGVYTFKGACTTINVSGGSNKLTIESVDELNLAGAKNTVTVGTVGAINLIGANNNVTWKAAKTGDSPAISHVGKDNVVAQAGGAAPKATVATTATATTKAGGGTVIDCAKQSTLTQVDNDATFTMTGKCDKIMISGNNNTVRVDSINNVMLSGNGNTIEAVAAGAISTSGNNNKVTYKSGLTATSKPKLLNSGNGNKINQGAVAASATATATATTTTATAAPKAPVAAAGGGTVIDCAKQSTLTQPDDGATFTMVGKCDKIMISGDHNKVKVDSVNNVMLSGDGNVIEAGAVGVISTSGDDNQVSYKSAVSSTKTKVMNTGERNKISSVK